MGVESATEIMDGSVAVIGVSCRFPAAPTPGSFWEILRGAEEVVAPTVPAGRPELSVAGLFPRAGLLQQIDGFDPQFFGISAHEAAVMDPQQRLMLELSWEALEDAGILPWSLKGSRAGVFVGAIWDEYAKLAHGCGEEGITHTTMTGLSRSVIANRVSYMLGVRGPSLAVDSAQSSSLVAVHLACESLRSGESTLALAGGVSLHAVPEGFRIGRQFGALSPDGRTYTFDARANGYVRGEGGGLVVLKTLRDALADGDSVLCVIRGSAMNNDGGGDNLTAPNQAAQEDVLRRAYERAGVDPADVGFVELHGTGTPVGDPVEAAALGAVIGSARPAGSPLLVGSVKTNIGHLEGAAGIAGLIKAVLCLTERTLVPSLNHQTPHPLIPLDSLNLEVNCAVRSLPDDDGPLFAGVSSFGMGGTNCHLVVSSWEGPTRGLPRPRPPAPEVAEEAGGPVPVLVSGRSRDALRAQAERLLDRLTARPELELVDVAHSLATTRTHFERRAVIVADNRDALAASLSDLAKGHPGPRTVEGTVEAGKVAFLFTGQGSQRLRMGQELYKAFPMFAAAFDTVCEQLDPRLDQPVRELLFETATTTGAGLLDETLYTQAALFAFEVALFRLLEHWGVTPDAVMGHSIGEVVVAHVAGVLSLNDACALVAARGSLMQRLPAGGAMVSIQAPEEKIRPSLDGCTGHVAIAAVNGPAAVVIAGDHDSVLAIARQWRERGHKTKRLRVSHAFHSPHMDGMLDEFHSVAAGLSYQQPRIPVVSTLTGREATAEELCSPDYWVRNVRETVRFLDGMRSLEACGVTKFLEVGPDAVLSVTGRDCLVQKSPVIVPAVRGSRPEVPTLFTALAQLHVFGVPVSWEDLLAGAGGRRVALPTYPFQRQRYWMPAPARTRDTGSSETASSGGNGAQAAPPHLSQEIEEASTHGAAQSDRSVDSFARLLAGKTPHEQMNALLDLVRSESARVLGYNGSTSIGTVRSFKEIGFDSFAAVELRNRMNEATGLRLSTTVLFDYPTPVALAGHVRDQMFPATAVGRATAVDEESEIRRILTALPLHRIREAGLLDALLRLGESDDAPQRSAEGGAHPLDDMDADDLLRLAQSIVGSPNPSARSGAGEPADDQ